jgi:hypothetical protein
MLVQLLPERIIGEACFPYDGAGVGEGGFLALVKLIGIRKVE